MKRIFILMTALLICAGGVVDPALSKVVRKQKQKRVTAVRRKTVRPKTVRKSNVEAKLGLIMMYDWWTPSFIKLQNGLTGNIKSHNMDATLSGSFMMGPTASVKVGRDWTVGATALFGLSRDRFRHSTLAIEGNYLYLTVPDWPVQWYADRGRSDVRRYDAEIAVERSMIKYLNVLFGVRVGYYEGEGRSKRLSSLYVPLTITNDETTEWHIGPYAGLGFQYEVNNFSVNLGVSALIRCGMLHVDRRMINPLLRIFCFVSDEFNIVHVDPGGEASLRLAYFIKRIRLEVFIGGRYAVLPHVCLYDGISAFNAAYARGWLTGEFDQFGALFFGAMYKF
ncbi:MAG: hypothetical protein JW807_15035 [Spirochaetes bacterium]|nr:hypothetical protein [Spirochaetota bacterium]